MPLFGPTLIGACAVWVASRIGEISPTPLSATMASFPSGVKAIDTGSPGTVMAFPGLLVVVLIGITLFAKVLVTYAVRPLGAIAMTPGD